MEHKYNKGSEWRKWDLHLHTASSYDYKYKADDSDKLLAGSLITNNISVVAITDHFVIDKTRIENLRALAPDIVIFPGVELRTDKGDTNIHVILLFSDKSNLNNLAEDFSAFKRTNAKNPGDNERIYWDFKDIIIFAQNHDAIISIHAGSKTSGVDKEISNALEHNIAVKTEYAEHIHIFEMGKIQDLDGYRKYVFPSTGEKPMIICSDNHDPRNYTLKVNCWIKSDPTFEGLKQIIYEPSDRVRLQKTDPTLDFEKSPFTEIIIPEKTQVFNDDADLFFDATTIQLNNNLISIIGGRGTGKSMLINYLAAGLNKRTDKNSYNISDKITIKRKTSLSENEKDFVLSNDPNIPFMYIAQSQIKELVTDKSKFTKNIRETIGVIDDYKIPDAYLLEAENLINEYYRIIKIVNSNNEDIIEKKKRIDLEIKKYVDFIANVTSEQNKVKLESYTKHIASINSINEWVERINLIKSSIQDFTTKTNLELASINDRFDSNGVLIPLLSAKDTIDYIETTVLAKFDQAKTKKQTEIDKTKEEFKGYSGDLSSLLSNISSYQTKLSELKSEKEMIEKEERLLVEIREEKFKLLGLKMEQSINDYTTQISEKWRLFKAGNPDLDTRKKEMLTSILGKDALNVSVKINFDTNKLYSLLMNKLDGRSFNVDKLKSEILKINTIDEFMKFVKQVDGKGVFDPQITSTLRSALIELFYKKHTNFITHEIVVTLNDKPITKLSHGQQGTIYLRLQIAANLFSETIIYDQPEDDLDNSFITEELVGIFKEIKKYRQVIIVSHNANLVVNADSEQVIIAKNEDGILKYTSGSLENTVINDSVCKVLEGGESAFRNRERKYHIHK